MREIVKQQTRPPPFNLFRWILSRNPLDQVLLIDGLDFIEDQLLRHEAVLIIKEITEIR